MLNIKTQLGNINFSQNIINKIVTECVKNVGDRVILLNYKGKYMNVVPGLASKMNLYDEEAGCIHADETDQGIRINVYIAVRFGVSIKKVTREIINSIYENFEKFMGEKPARVTVTVTGTFSKNSAKRHIEVSR